MQQKRIWKRFAAGALMALVVCANIRMMPEAAVNNENSCPVESNGWTNWPAGPDISCGTGILMEAKSGEVLYSKGMDDPRYPASITKIMTTLVALENSTMDTAVTFTETGMADAYSGSSNILPQLGETFPMEECLYMIMVKSANDVSTQVAEVVGGSVEAFVSMMNEKAVELGCTNTHFNNASGLPDANHYTTAHDMARIARAAMQNETFRKITSTQRHVVPESNLAGARDYTNHHKLLLDGSAFHYDGCIGGKTGYTDSSLSTLVTFANRDNMELICVVMYGLGDDVVCTDTTNLLNYGYDNFQIDQDGLLTTKTGKYILDEEALTKTEYEKKSEEKQMAEKDTEEEQKTAEVPSEKKEQKKTKTPIVARVIIAVLVILILWAVASCVLSVRRQRRRRQMRRRRRKRNNR